MATQSYRLVVWAVRAARGQVRPSRVVRAYSIDAAPFAGGTLKPQAQPQPEKPSHCHSLTQRNLSAVALSSKGQCRPLSRYDFLDVGEVEEHTKKALACRTLRRFIVDPALARLVADELEGDLADSRAVLFECNPGPGVLTRTLLNSGAQRVIALEMLCVQALENSLDGQLEVVHCDFFKLDPIGQGSMKPPAMYSEKLFNDLGISQVPWTADVPVKVVGIFAQRNERSMLWKLIYALYERLSVFRFGRVELIMFISEKEYTKMVASPGDMKSYLALGCLWQMACDIQLLHKEPWSSFVTTSKHGGLAIPRSSLTNDHLCLVRMTPRRELFTDTLTTSTGATLVMMIKQCLAKRKAKLVDRLNSWSPGTGQKLLLQMELPEDILTGHLYPEEYKKLFEAMEHSEEFAQSWLYEEILENTQNTGFQ
ncbi:TFB2M transferase, partial [Atractosteus spatula]|nr:TFB2M transferase [Atractosteus spatula]